MRKVYPITKDKHVLIFEWCKTGIPHVGVQVSHTSIGANLVYRNMDKSELGRRYIRLNFYLWNKRFTIEWRLDGRY